MDNIKDKVAIVGIGATEFYKDSQRTEYSLACEAIKAAVDECGLNIEDIDGMVKDVDDGYDPSYVQKALGIDNLLYASETHWGTSAMMNAVSSVAAGVANYVVYYRCRNGSSSQVFSPSDYRVAREVLDDSLDMIRYDFYSPFGLLTSEAYVAMTAQRYMHEYGARSEQFGGVVMACSEHASKNPKAIFIDKPISLEEYMKSEVIVDPLRAMDHAPGVDAGIAIIVTTAERAKDLKNKPAIIMSIAAGSAMDGELLTSYNRSSLTGLPEMENVAKDIFPAAGVTAKDIKVAQLDDSFVPYVPMQLEALGFCGRGEGAAFCEGGDRLRVGGEIPINTAGGSLGEGTMGSNRIIEAVRQIRGTSTCQVDNADLVLVASGAGGPADAFILRG